MIIITEKQLILKRWRNWRLLADSRKERERERETGVPDACGLLFSRITAGHKQFLLTAKTIERSRPIRMRVVGRPLMAKRKCCVILVDLSNSECCEVVEQCFVMENDEISTIQYGILFSMLRRRNKLFNITRN